MSPKGRKSLTFWEKCQVCSCILSAKNALKHSEFCEKPKSEWPFGYIENNILYSSIEDIKNRGADIRNKSYFEGERKYLSVFISRSVMQLCGFCVGSPVIVEIQGYSTIMNPWPFNGNTLTVLVFKEAFELQSGLKLTSSNVKISKLESKPSIAKEIFYQMITPEENGSWMSELTKLLPYKFNNKLILVGMNFIVQHYGRRLHIKISKVNEYPFGISPVVNSHSDLCYVSLSTSTWINETEEESVDKIYNEIIYKKIGGYQTLLSELKMDILQTFSRSLISEDILSLCILIYGPSGTGKTVISQHLAHTSGKEVVNIRGFEMYSTFYGESENQLRKYFEDARKKAPCVIIMDNVETFCSKKGTGQERRLLSTLISMFETIRNLPIVLIACTVNPHLLDPSLRCPGRLEREIEIPIPDNKDRYEILKALLPDPALDKIIMDLSTSCYGFVGGDLASLVDKAVQQAKVNNKPTVTVENLQWAFRQIRPSAMTELHIDVPSVKWTDIGGGKDVRRCLEQAVIWPLKFPHSLARLGIQAPKGILLYGPPGCSKTLTVKALATETKLNFISVKGSDVYSKWVGESEKMIRKLFRSARKVAPSIVFIDEADALCVSRGSSGCNSVQDRVLSELLTEMDGVNPLEGVIVVAATNRPDFIDKALLRPGRLDRIIYVPLPDYETRLQIFEIQFKITPTKNVNIGELSTKTDKYSGAEVVAVCKEAALIALKEDMNASHVKMSHFLEALKFLTPRTPTSLLKLYDDFRKQRHKL